MYIRLSAPIAAEPAELSYSRVSSLRFTNIVGPEIKANEVSSNGNVEPVSLHLRQAGRSVDGEMHLADLDLDLNDGGFYVVLGPTHAGKTSLLRLLAGLDAVHSGEFCEVDALTSEERNLKNVGVRRRDVAFVYQAFVNYPTLSVFENIASPLRVAGIPAAELEERVRSAAALLHIAELLDRRPGELSGGQQQRVAIARALVKRARLTLLDEPFANLDYKLRERLRRELRFLFADAPAGGERAGIAVYATSDPAEALMFGETAGLIVLDAGRIVARGPALQVYEAPPNLRAAVLLSDPPMNLLPVPESLRSEYPGVERLGVRAHRLELSRGQAATTDDAKLLLRGRAELAEVGGSETFVHVKLTDEAFHGSEVIARMDGPVHFALDEEVTCAVHPKNLFRFQADGTAVG